MKRLTIFTPTYNRAYILGELYQSLCAQTNQDFEWIIVDDGSTDDTKEKVQGWISEEKIQIIYLYQENAGKSAAHNRGLELADTELFTCVDSDDQLKEDAVEILLAAWDKAKESGQEVGGLLAFRVKPNGTPITEYNGKSGLKIAKVKEFYDKKTIKGDTVLIFDISKFGSLRFPMIEGEKFVPEFYLCDQFDQISPVMIVPEYIYVCEYLEDGYTAHMAQLLATNPKGYLAYIEQRLGYDDNIKCLMLDSIRYVAIAICAKKKNIIRSAPSPFCAFLMYPFGRLFYYMRYRKLC